MSNKPLQIRLELNADGNVRKVVQGVNGDLGVLESQTERTGLAIKRMGHYAVGAMAGYLSVSAMKQVVAQVAQFESAMLSLRAVSGATEAQMKSLERQARDLGATSVFSAQQAAQAQTFLAQAGFDVNEVLGATPGLLQLAVAGNLDLARAADIASNVLGGMRLEVDELNRVNDVLAKTAASSNTNIEQLGDAFSYAAPFAAGAGIAIEEAAAAIGILSDNGLQASRAGTGMIGMIRQLSTFTPQSEAVLAKYGLTVKDVDIKTHGFAEVMRRLQPISQDTGDVIKVFGSEAGAAAQIIMNGTERLSEFTNELNNAQGAAQAMADIMGGGLVNAQKAFGSATDETILSLNDYLGINQKATASINTLTDVVLDINYALRYSQSEISGLGDVSDVVIESLKAFIKTIHAGYTVTMQMAHSAQFLVRVLNTKVSLTMFEDIANHARWAAHQIESYQTQHNQFLVAINRDGQAVRATYAEMDRELNEVINSFDRMHRASLKPVTVTAGGTPETAENSWNWEYELDQAISAQTKMHQLAEQRVLMERKWREKVFQEAKSLVEQQALMERKWREQAFVEQRVLTSEIAEYEVAVTSMGDAWARTGNQALDAMGSMMSMLGTLADNEKAHQAEMAKIATLRAQNDAKFAKGSAQWKANDAKLTQQQMQLDKQRINQSIAGSAGMLSAASAMYKEGSKEAKIAHQASLALHAVEMGMKMKEAIANATVSTTAAGALPPPLGFASVAAMAALMGGVLSNIGASFSGSGSSANIPQAASGNELGALGGGGSGETLAKTQQLFDVNVDQYRELTAIRNASQKTANSIENLLGAAFKTGDMRNLTTPSAATGRIGNEVSKAATDYLTVGGAIGGKWGGWMESAAQSLFGSKTTMTGARLEISGALDEVMIGGFQDFKKTSKWKSTKKWTEEIALDQTLTDGIQYTLGMLGDQMSESAKLLGKNIEDDFARLNVVIGDIDMTGKPEEVMERLQTAFGKQADYMAKTLFPELLQYQKLMESQAEAVARVSMQKHIIDDVSASFDVVFDDAVRVSQAFDQVAGGFEAFTRATQTLQDAFFDDQRKHEENLRKLNNVLAQQNLVLPASREQYLQITESFYAMGEAGADLYMAMSSAADMADTYYKKLEEGNKKLEDAVLIAWERFESQSKQIERGYFALMGAEQLLAYEREQQLAQIDPLLQAHQQRLWLLEDEAKRTKALNDQRKAFNKQSENANKFMGDFAKSVRGFVAGLVTGVSAISVSYADTLELAKTADRQALSSIVGVAGQYVQDAQSQFGSRADYMRLQASVAADLNKLTQISPEEYLAREIEASLKAQTATLDQSLVSTLPAELQAVVSATEYSFDAVLDFAINDASMPTDLRTVLIESIDGFERTLGLAVETSGLDERTRDLIVEDNLKSSVTLQTLLANDTDPRLVEMVMLGEQASTAVIHSILDDGVIDGIEDVILGKTLHASSVMDAALNSDMDDSVKHLITQNTKAFTASIGALLSEDLSDNDAHMLIQAYDGIYRDVITAAVLGDVDEDAWTLAIAQNDTINKTLAASKGTVNADAWTLVNASTGTVTKTLAAAGGSLTADQSKIIDVVNGTGNAQLDVDVALGDTASGALKDLQSTVSGAKLTVTGIDTLAERIGTSTTGLHKAVKDLEKALNITVDITTPVTVNTTNNVTGTTSNSTSSATTSPPTARATTNLRMSGAVADFDGGYTGHGGKYDFAGTVHRGEYVLSQDMIRRMGGQQLVRDLEEIRLGGGNPNDDLIAMIHGFGNKGFFNGGYTGGNLPNYTNGGLVGLRAHNPIGSRTTGTNANLNTLADAIKQTNQRLDTLIRVSDVSNLSRTARDQFEIVRRWNWSGLPETRTLTNTGAPA